MEVVKNVCQRLARTPLQFVYSESMKRKHSSLKKKSLKEKKKLGKRKHVKHLTSPGLQL
jgi:hypothetical protein